MEIIDREIVEKVQLDAIGFGDDLLTPNEFNDGKCKYLEYFLNFFFRYHHLDFVSVFFPGNKIRELLLANEKANEQIASLEFQIGEVQSDVALRGEFLNLF